MTGLSIFLLTIAVTLIITYAAAKKSSGRADMYSAGGRLTGIQNGWAVSGDFMSATTFLGLTGLYFLGGVDVAIYFLTPLAGFCVMMLIIVVPLRKLGQYTLGDVIQAKVPSVYLRVFVASATIVISLIYLIAQLVGAGTLIAILFDIDYLIAVTVIAALMTTYVAFGGMLATSWVQIVKAGILVFSAVVLTMLCLTHFDGISEIYRQAERAHSLGGALFAPGGFQLTMFESVSLTVGLVLGMAGMPHLLIRFFTVPNEREARKSIVTASMVVGLVFCLLFAVVAPSAVALVTGNPQFTGIDGGVAGGSNMVIMHLSSVLGGEVLFGFLSAAAFATILAVVSGLTIAIASAASNDLYRTFSLRDGKDTRIELIVFRVVCFGTAVLAVCLAIIFRDENVAFLSAMAFSVAASANFPVLALVLYWKSITALGAFVGGMTGLISSVVLIILGPAVWVKVLGYAEPIVPVEFPALLSAPLAVAGTVGVSIAMRRKERAKESIQRIKARTG